MEAMFDLDVQVKPTAKVEWWESSYTVLCSLTC
ncbi:hypothetical protein C7459_10993 [Tumebacillus permanentifrigoris]|uniref:Uncharacterized protein n=1 Tax=Tumebacillus permanentifrigoris TaxID=378543 RepID=A0A316D9X9_9BACL|nr:hypothetical protein C7459_10993 [Tumebacillus permanentifrigoris]